MMNDNLTEDTKAIILLCGVFGEDRSQKPLSSEEYSSLVLWLMEEKMRPSDLLHKDNIQEASIGSGIDEQRLESLLGRGIHLGFAVEEWQRNGIWIISRSDPDYPARYKRHLKNKSPPLLFGVGNRSLLTGGGLGIVGSRNVDQTAEAFTRQVAEHCAYNRMLVVSGGARGVDQISMNAALEAGGFTIGFLADNLLKKSVERSSRQAIFDGRLLLLSPYHPNAHFNVGLAMNRNKLIYAMSDYVLVVSAEHKKGGTWAGAEEELKRENAMPVFVRNGNDVPTGNSKLLNLGAISWPEKINRNNFRLLMHDLAVNAQDKRSNKNSSLLDIKAAQDSVSNEELPLFSVLKEDKTLTADTEPVVESEVKTSESSASVYQAVLPIILNKLNCPFTAEELAKALDVNKTQLYKWLKQGVEENKIIKLTNPVCYQKAESGKQE